MKPNRLFTLISLMVLVGLVSTAFSPGTPNLQPARAGVPSAARVGGWVDQITFTADNDANHAISELAANNLDVFASKIGDSKLLQNVKFNPELEYSNSLGSLYELSLNPYGPFYNDGRLNPFYNPKIRESLNWLIDRDFIVTYLLGGLGLPKLMPITTSLVEYTRYFNKTKELELAYAFNQTKALQVISTEMLGMGAVMVNGKWHYQGQPITLIFVIRVEDVRKQIGDYVANQIESAGFIVDRQYKTRNEASPIWLQGNPADGLFHIYTGGWISSAISRDQGSEFSFFYTPHDYLTPLWQSYVPSAEFDTIALKLRDINYSDMTERETLFNRALELSLSDPGSGSVRIWLVEQTGFSPRRANTSVSSDRVGGIAGSTLWSYTIRFEGLEGGNMRIAQPGILVEPWNPIGGSNWLYDKMPIHATQDYGKLSDPNDGLAWPQRISHAEILARNGLPITKSLSWVNLSFTPQITVPDDAWVDWDAATQTFITAAQKYASPQTANIKSTVYYPAGLFSVVKWHDGSPLDLSDFVMKMIMTFDPGKPNSAIFNPELEDGVNYFLGHFKGVKILSSDPLVIETYEDSYQLDAELNVYDWWPNYDYGPSAWHNLAVGERADAAHALAFTSGKANSLGIGWMNFIGDASLGILQNYLSQSAAQNYVPYPATLSAYISPAEATARWSNLTNWYNTHGNFWLGTGPYYLAQADYTNGRVILNHNPTFADPAGKWDSYSQEPQLSLNYSDGAPSSYLTLTGTGYPGNTTEFITINDQNLAIVPTSLSSGNPTRSNAQPGFRIPVGPNGSFTLILNTTGSPENRYKLETKASPAEEIWFTLDDTLPLRPQQGTGEIFNIPPNIAYWWQYMSLINRFH